MSDGCTCLVCWLMSHVACLSGHLARVHRSMHVQAAGTCLVLDNSLCVGWILNWLIVLFCHVFWLEPYSSPSVCSIWTQLIVIKHSLRWSKNTTVLGKLRLFCGNRILQLIVIQMKTFTGKHAHNYDTPNPYCIGYTWLSFYRECTVEPIRWQYLDGEEHSVSILWASWHHPSPLRSQSSICYLPSGNNSRF